MSAPTTGPLDDVVVTPLLDRNVLFPLLQLYKLKLFLFTKKTHSPAGRQQTNKREKEKQGKKQKVIGEC